jgi:hypothetical protein
MTTRRWMIAVAVVAVVVALTIEAYRARQRREAYLARAAYYARREAAYRHALARARRWRDASTVIQSRRGQAGVRR